LIHLYPPNADRLSWLSHDWKNEFQAAILPLPPLSSPPLDKELGINSGGDPGRIGPFFHLDSRLRGNDRGYIILKWQYLIKTCHAAANQQNITTTKCIQNIEFPDDEENKLRFMNIKQKL
jgi:hypothetical protein